MRKFFKPRNYEKMEEMCEFSLKLCLLLKMGDWREPKKKNDFTFVNFEGRRRDLKISTKTSKPMEREEFEVRKKTFEKTVPKSKESARVKFNNEVFSPKNSNV